MLHHELDPCSSLTVQIWTSLHGWSRYFELLPLCAMCASCQRLQVLLVGGATRMPGVRQLVTNMTGLDAKVSLIDPDQVWWLPRPYLSCSVESCRPFAY